MGLRLDLSHEPPCEPYALFWFRMILFRMILDARTSQYILDLSDDLACQEAYRQDNQWDACSSGLLLLVNVKQLDIPPLALLPKSITTTESPLDIPARLDDLIDDLKICELVVADNRDAHAQSEPFVTIEVRVRDVVILTKIRRVRDHLVELMLETETGDSLPSLSTFVRPHWFFESTADQTGLRMPTFVVYRTCEESTPPRSQWKRTFDLIRGRDARAELPATCQQYVQSIWPHVSRKHEGECFERYPLDRFVS